ncbi:MAG: CPBP family glutamic-type intramembrane protease [Anaerolineales bacterium]
MPTSRPLRLRIAGLDLEGRSAVAIVAVTLLLMLDAYHTFLPGEGFTGALRAKALERFVYYLVVPLVIIVFVFRDSPREYGFTWGDWRQGLKWAGLLIALSIPVILTAGRTPAMARYYAAYRGTWPDLMLTFLLDLVGWEFVFRGFLLFALYRLMGPTAVVLQAMPFALAHIGKPELETLSTIFGGSLFGWIAWRSRSFVYPFLLHWFIFSLVVFVARAGAA